MKIGIVGSRSRNSKKDKKSIFDVVFENIKQDGFENVQIFSGGCAEGADSFAEEAAKYFGVSITIHYPQALPKPKNYGEAVERYYTRNIKIAENVDILYAMVSNNRAGGTEHTIKEAKKLGKKIVLILPDHSREEL